LSNLRQALTLLLQAGDEERAVDLANSLMRFLTNFGLLRERERLQQRITSWTLSWQEIKVGDLIQTEYLREINLAEEERSQGHLDDAVKRLQGLLQRLQIVQCRVLGELARCYEAGGQPTEAERVLSQALSLNEALLAQPPEEGNLLHQRGALLFDLGNAQLDQGNYTQARTSYEQVLSAYDTQQDSRGRAVVFCEMGTLALKQQEYGEAKTHYQNALQQFLEIHRRQMVGIGGHLLSMRRFSPTVLSRQEF
jgi:tetratricopeptide (TPR) repeat protein